MLGCACQCSNTRTAISMPGVKSISFVSSNPVRPRSYTIFKSKQSNICPWSLSSVPSVASVALATEADSSPSAGAWCCECNECKVELEAAEATDADAASTISTCATAAIQDDPVSISDFGESTAREAKGLLDSMDRRERPAAATVEGDGSAWDSTARSGGEFAELCCSQLSNDWSSSSLLPSHSLLEDAAHAGRRVRMPQKRIGREVKLRMPLNVLQFANKIPSGAWASRRRRLWYQLSPRGQRQSSNCSSVAT